MKNENIPVEKLLRHIKFCLIQDCIYNRFRAHGYKVDSEYIGNAGDVRWIKRKTKKSFMMFLKENGIELLPDPEYEGIGKLKFIQQLVAEGIFAPVGNGLFASYEQSLDHLLPAIRDHLDDTQLLRCVRSRPCVDWSWLERGYF